MIEEQDSGGTGCAAATRGRLTRERDSCGIGFVADIGGRRRHRVLEMALEALANLGHRGGVSADGESGDGVGVLTQLPRRLLDRALERRGEPAPGEGELAVGVFFLPRDDAAAAACRELIEQALAQGDLELLAWRDVPIRPEVLGEEARAACPRIRQALIRRPPGLEDEAFERRLYLTRRRVERRGREAGIEGLHAVSLSHRTVVYKAMALPARLAEFYGDLADPVGRLDL